MRLIDADALYERLRDDEDLARKRVIVTPNSFPNGMLNPAAVRYMAQLSERTRIKEIVYDAPTIEPERKKGRWIEDAETFYKAVNEKGGGVNEDTPYFVDDIACSECLALFSVIDNCTETFNFCPACGADMRGEENG